MSMTFTDDDLKRLKADLAANRRMEWPMPDCEALVARLERSEAERDALKTRLEAAENAVEDADGCDKGEIDSCVMRVSIQAWKKVAGK